MSPLIAVTKLLARHEQALTDLGLHEANGNLLKVNLQLNRLRTGKEQLELLTQYYTETLAALKSLDDNGYAQLPLLKQLMDQSAISMDEVNAFTEQYAGFTGQTGQLETVDFTSIEQASLSDIPKDHLIYPILQGYKDYAAGEHFLDRIKELMDLLDESSSVNKLTAEQVQEVKEEKSTSLTAAQKVLALYYLMRWAGIELGDRQGARQHRFIAALTGIAVGTVKERFPTGSVTDKPNHIQNLKALIPLFESINAQKLVEKIEAAISLEEEERRD